MTVAGLGRALRAVAVAGLLGCLLTGCAGLADAPLIGVPANAPPRPASPTAFLPVHDVPPPREEHVPTAEEQSRLQKELLSARDRQNAQASALAKGKAK